MGRFRGFVSSQLLALAAIAVGALLRAWYLGSQVVQGDERWTLQVSLNETPAYFLTHHDTMSFSVPLAMWNWALANSVGLSEWGIRLPVLVTGIAVLPLLGAFARRHYGSSVSVIAIWVATLSPILVLYSRFARPYIGVFAACLVAIWGWTEWRDERRARGGLMLALGGAAAVFLHLFAAPAVAVLWGAALAFDLFVRGAPEAGKRHPVVATAGWIALGTLALALSLLPSAESLLDFVAGKQGVDDASTETWLSSTHILMGTLHPAALAWQLATAALGAVACWRRDRLLCALLLGLLAVQIVAVVVLAPRMSLWSYVTARYLMPALPGLVILLALGWAEQGRLFGSLVSRVQGGEGHASVASGAFIALGLVAMTSAGPLPALYADDRSFSSHPDFYSPPGPLLIEEEVPLFYSFLASLEEDVEIIEAPDTRPFYLTPYGHYQLRHGHPVRTTTVRGMMADSRLRLDSVVPLDRVSEIEGLDYVVIHHSLADEFRAVSPFPNARRDRAYGNAEAQERLERPARWAKRIVTAFEANPSFHRVWDERWLVVFAATEEAAERVASWRESLPPAPRPAE